MNFELRYLWLFNKIKRQKNAIKWSTISFVALLVILPLFSIYQFFFASRNFRAQLAPVSTYMKDIDEAYIKSTSYIYFADSCLMNDYVTKWKLSESTRYLVAYPCTESESTAEKHSKLLIIRFDNAGVGFLNDDSDFELSKDDLSGRLSSASRSSVPEDVLSELELDRDAQPLYVLESGLNPGALEQEKQELAAGALLSMILPCLLCLFIRRNAVRGLAYSHILLEDARQKWAREQDKHTTS